MLNDNPTLTNMKDAINSLGSMSLVNDAPIDGNEYTRKNGIWTVSSGGGSGSVTGFGDTANYDEDQLVITSGASTVQELYDIEANTFSPSSSYNIGDYVIYEGKLYRFISNHSTTTWDSNHVEYINVTDELKNKVNKSGDIMTGALSILRPGEASFIASNTTNAIGADPINDGWQGTFAFKDKNWLTTGYLGLNYTSAKNTYIRTLARAKDANNTNVENYFDLYANYDGTKSIYFSAPNAWRKALFPSNLASSGEYLLGITEQWEGGGYIPKAAVCDWAGATKVIVQPNDIANKLITRHRVTDFLSSFSGQRYFPLVEFPAYQATTNLASAIITGRIGGWEAGNIGFINMIVCNRGAAGISPEVIAVPQATISNIYEKVNFVMYFDSSTNKHKLYLVAASYSAFDLNIDIYNPYGDMKYLFDGSYVTTAPENEAAKASSSNNRVEIYDGKLYVGGIQK